VALDQPGHHVVELRFEPLSHALGAVVSLVSLVLLSGLIGWGFRR
jgi:hypothetical protein